MFLWTLVDSIRTAIEIPAATPIRLDDDDRVVARVSLDALPLEGVLLIFLDGDWLLLAPRVARVQRNGRPLDLGIVVLRDRDQLTVRSRRYVISFETLARVESYRLGTPPGGMDGEPTPCARCHRNIVDGDLSVRCPRCGLRYHQHEASACWTYSPTCVECDQPTDLDGEPRYVPELSS